MIFLLKDKGDFLGDILLQHRMTGSLLVTFYKTCTHLH